MFDARHEEIAKLEALYVEHPEGRVFTHLAEAYRKAGDLERARDVLAEGIQRHPDYSSAHVVLGRVLMDLGDNDEARAEFRRVLELDRHNLVALRSLGDIARGEGRTEDALEHYHALLDLEPADADVREIVEALSEGLVVPGPEDELPGLPESEDELPGLPDAEDRDEGDASWEVADEVGGADIGEPVAAEEVSEGPVEEPDAGSVEGADVMTETIAHVYARQGLYDRAVEVYQELIRARPDDEGLKARLAALREEAGARDAAESAEAAPELEEPWASGEPWEAGETVAAESDDGLEGTEVGESPEELTPDDEAPVAGFQSVEFEVAESVEAEPLEGLQVEEPEPDAAPWLVEEPMEQDPGAEAEIEQGAEPELEPEPETWDPAEVLSEEPEVEAESPADVTTPAYEEPIVEEPVAEEPVVEEPVVEEPASPWTDTVEAAEPEAETPYAWADTEEPEEDASPPISSYLKGLLDFGAGTPTPADSVPTESVPGGAGPEAVGDEDDDLDMFRSWLESLKQ